MSKAIAIGVRCQGLKIMWIINVNKLLQCQFYLVACLLKFAGGNYAYQLKKSKPYLLPSQTDGQRHSEISLLIILI